MLFKNAVQYLALTTRFQESNILLFLQEMYNTLLTCIKASLRRQIDYVTSIIWLQNVLPFIKSG